MIIKEIKGKQIFDSRKDKTIEISVITENGTFSASCPNGKSTGKNETRSFSKSIAESIEMLKKSESKIKEAKIEQFSDLEEIEKICDKNIFGANALVSLELAILKALALEQGKQLWQIINEKASRFPFPIGNCIGGGAHSDSKLKPDFQEFLIIPRAQSFAKNLSIMGRTHDLCGKKLIEQKARLGLSDENAWKTNLNDEQCLEILDSIREELEEKNEAKIEVGIDIASSTFCSGKNYVYKNPFRVLEKKEQMEYISEIAGKYRVSYIEDPLDEEDFSGFAELRKKLNDEKPTLIVGDDLVASQLKRLGSAIMKKSISMVIVKPNQNGSLIEIKKLADYAKKYGIATVMSHRSGETMDSSLADLAFGLQTEFIKTGIIGKEREIKLKRLAEIEKEKRD